MKLQERTDLFDKILLTTQQNTCSAWPRVTRSFLIRSRVDTTCFNIDSSLLTLIGRLPP